MDGKKRAPDTIEPQENEVIIAGFGRFGQIVGRMLYSQGYSATVLDHDPDQIDMLRRFGFKVFYGDATRMDLLETAGAARARMRVVAIDDMETSLEVVDRVRERFPHLTLYVRARNVSHVYQLRDRGVEVIDRIRKNQNRAEQVILLRDLCDTMTHGSLCAMGGMTPFPVLSALNHYPQDFGLAAPDQAAA
jgi:voltage-gated potassium channel Kch